MDAAVVFNNVSYAYNQAKVLEDVSVTIEKEEFFGIIGPNAAGKSTLLKLMLGLLKPDSGNIEVLGLRPAEAARYIGYVPQYPTFPRDFPIKVIDVVLLGHLGSGIRLGGFSRQEKHRAMESLAVVAIENLAETPIAALSGGQLQRMLIARALTATPEILVLDEPTANIDVQAEENIFGLLKQYNSRMSIIVVSHDIAFISGYVDRVGCLNRTLVCHETESINGKTIEELYGTPVKMIHHAH